MQKRYLTVDLEDKGQCYDRKNNIDVAVVESDYHSACHHEDAAKDKAKRQENITKEILEPSDSVSTMLVLLNSSKSLDH